MIRGVSVSTQKRAQKLSCETWATEKGKAGGPDFQAQFDKSAGQASGDQKFRNRLFYSKRRTPRILRSVPIASHFRQPGNTSFQSVILSAIESRTGTKKRTRTPKTLRIKEISLIFLPRFFVLPSRALGPIRKALL